jgi:epoxyqueuosine reductase QueG
MKNKKEFCKCKEPKYMASAMPDRIYSCGICWKPIKWDQCINNIKMKIDEIKMDETKMNEILGEMKSWIK